MPKPPNSITDAAKAQKGDDVKPEGAERTFLSGDPAYNVMLGGVVNHGRNNIIDQ